MAEQVVIIGTGPAGWTAAIYAARANLKPLVVEGIQPGGQLTTTTSVENFPGFPEGLDGTQLMLQMRSQAERFGARIQNGEVSAVDFKRQPFRLKLDDGQAMETQAVIIATGASAQYMGLASEQKLLGRGVSGCATCDGALYRGKPVAVVGGGDTAMEDALFLTRFAAQVTVIHRRDEFRASRIMAERVKQHPKIKIMWNTVVDEVLDVAREEVTGLRLKNVKTGALTELSVAGVFIAIGHQPNTKAFVGQVAMDDKGYILTEHTRTNVPGIFAAGDVQDHTYRQAVTAAGSGCMAAIEVERYLKH
ncbi:MAG: thioredoxin-disulfide reductase [Kiritimatiellaeota bacterium]|nr:thioredoxin-disulfide reductase [Kiritimatiellota bacterium]